MKYLELTLATPEENLACDEALLDLCEAGAIDEVLRIWESPAWFVAVGYAGRREAEADLAVCRRKSVPVRRRCSGGGTVLQGPGSLCYSLILRMTDRARESITGTNRYVMSAHRDSLQSLVSGRVTVEGHTDLALDDLKFSGNAQRRRRRSLLFHGTFLYGMNFELVEEVLLMPPKAPAYRGFRKHVEFLTNFPAPAPAIVDRLRTCWNADHALEIDLQPQIADLVDSRYGTDAWNQKF